MKNVEIRKILIVRLSALGDTIHTLPLANALRKKYPDAQIDWVVEDKASKFIVNNPLLNNVYVLQRKNVSKTKAFKSFREIIKAIRKEKYDIAIDTQQLFKSGIISGLSGAKRRISLNDGREFSFVFSNEIIKSKRKQFDINYHVVKRNLEIAEYLGCKTENPEFVIPDFSTEVSETVKDVMSKLDSSKKTVVAAPGTTWANKHWTVEGWIDVINSIKENCNIILTGTEKEKPIIDGILNAVKGRNITDLSGKTGLSDLVYIFKKSDAVISPDSGSAHVAWAVSHPCVITLFFATSANRTAPFGDKYFSVSAKTVCSPCMKKHCRLKRNKNQCISSIDPKNIVNILKKVL